MDLFQFFNPSDIKTRSITEQMLFNQWLEKLEHYLYKEGNVIWVSQLVRCKRKAEFEEEMFYVYRLEPYFIMANLIHIGLQKWLQDNYSFEIEKEFQKELAEYVIRGRVDAINKDTVIEIKCTKDVRDNKPYEHHVLQLRLYLWLTGREHGKLIYITPNKLLEFDIHETMDDDEVLLLIDNWKSPRYEWECSYCDFACICNQAVVRR